MTNDIYKFLSRKVHDERKQTGLTIEQLAEAAGIGPSFLAYIEASERKPSLDTVARLAAALNIPLPALFADAPTKPADRDHKLLQQFGALVRGKTPAQKMAILNTVKALAKSFEK